MDFREAWPRQAASIGALMVPGMALWLPSGYSYGAAFIFMAALLGWRHWQMRPAPSKAHALACVFISMAVLWGVDVWDLATWGAMDRPAKYLVALPCLYFLMACPPKASFIWWGIAVGAAGSGLIGVYQTEFQGLPRATGFTNAIQYGGLSMLLALMAGLALLIRWPAWRASARCGLIVALCLGVVGSVLSQSRGGWLMLVVLVPVLAAIVIRTTSSKAGYLGLVVLAFVAAGASQLPLVEERVREAQTEVASFQERGEGQSSVGQRLAHWRLAWDMGWEKPMTGWGRVGYESEKARRVAVGLVHPFVLQFGHAHNEVLDMFAKRGLPGVAMLVVFYLVPAWIFWPTRRRTVDRFGQLDEDLLALSLIGVALPLSYIFLGLTQVFLAHNSGNMFYLFMCPIVLAALEARRCQLSAAPVG